MFKKGGEGGREGGREEAPAAVAGVDVIT